MLVAMTGYVLAKCSLQFSIVVKGALVTPFWPMEALQYLNSCSH